MSIAFDRPLALLLLLLIPPALWFARRRLAGFRPGQRRLALAVRALLFAVLTLAIADPRAGRPDDRLALAFAVDVSASVLAPQRALQEDWVRRALSLAGPGDQVEVLEFGRHAARRRSGGISMPPPPEATNLEAALELGAAVLPPSGRRRVVVLGDGQQNLGRAQEVAARLDSLGVEVSFLRPEPPAVLADALVRAVEAPSYIREGETLQVDALVESSLATSATIRLSIGDQVVSESQVDLRSGAQRIPLVARPRELGFHRLRAEVVVPDDALVANNAADGFTVVKPTGRVLVLEASPGAAAELDQALRTSGLQTEVRPTSAVPPSADSLQVYEAVVLANVPSTALTLDQQTTLQSYVQDLGRGLFVVGGNTSFSLGAYANSPLGNVLPVDPVPPSRRERGNVALFLVVDKSGSMEIYRSDASKMAMAREAALLAVDALSPGDEVGVIAFDDRYEWVAPPTRLSGPDDQRAVRSRIAALKADGGTQIFPALEAAYQAAAASQAKLKHIILLTDGQAPQGDYDALIARMKPQNITLTTVGVGSDTDTGLLTRLAQLGEGRYYFTERAPEVPKIVTRETTIVSRNPMIEGLVQPQTAMASPLLADLQGQTLPPVNGYVATTPRPRAHTVLTSDRGDPLLAHWHYGLGRVVAWTSDGQRQWAGPWLDSEDALRMFGQAVRWAMPQPSDPLFQVNGTASGDRLTLRLNAYDANGRFSDRRDVRATVSTPDGRAFELPLRQVGPGAYETRAQAPGPGAYAVKVDEVQGEQSIRSETGGVVVVADEELRTIGPNRALLEQLAQMTGGRELVEPADAYRRDSERPIPLRWAPLWPWLVGLALLLLPLDVAVRRFRLGAR